MCLTSVYFIVYLSCDKSEHQHHIRLTLFLEDLCRDLNSNYTCHTIFTKLSLQQSHILGT